MERITLSVVEIDDETDVKSFVDEGSLVDRTIYGPMNYNYIIYFCSLSSKYIFN